jgi:hypothetical protein
LKRYLIPAVAAVGALTWAPSALAQEPQAVRPVQSAYQFSLSEQVALALAAGDGGGLEANGLSTPSTPAEALATNLSRTLQIIRQVQRGCQSYCYGEKMVQRAWQKALTEQNAVAVAEGGGGAAAAAINLAETIQTIEQIQHGCRIFCYGVSMTQEAWQSANTDQYAAALASGAGGDAAAALAANMRLTRQVIKQIQKACRLHCFGIELSQKAWQDAGTGQDAFAAADGVEALQDGTEQASLAGDAPGFDLVAMQAVAENLSETLEMLEQIQADCERFCYHGVGLSDAEWFERTGLGQVFVDPLEEQALLAEDGAFEETDAEESGTEATAPEETGTEATEPEQTLAEGAAPEQTVPDPTGETVSADDIAAGAVDAAAGSEESEPVEIETLVAAAEALNDSMTEQELEQVQL